MAHIFHARDLLARARVGLALPETHICVCCGHDEYDASDMAVRHYASPELLEAQKHYGGAICTGCFEEMLICAQCGHRRREGDMWALGDDPVCSAVCDMSFEYDNTNADNRLGKVEYGL